MIGNTFLQPHSGHLLGVLATKGNSRNRDLRHEDHFANATRTRRMSSLARLEGLGD
jgi:hypothetical protein